MDRIGEKQNRDCATKFNEVLFKLIENGHTNNAIMNGLLFTLSLHTINSNFLTPEVIAQYRQLYDLINNEVKKEKNNKEEPIVMYPDRDEDIPWD